VLQGLGIRDEFQQLALTSCVDELRTQDNLTEEQKDVVKYAGSYTANDHQFVLMTFSTLTNCDSCDKVLRGLFHQGLICQRELIYQRLTFFV